MVFDIIPEHRSENWVARRKGLVTRENLTILISRNLLLGLNEVTS